jgi:uncharacterized protein YndB with AHSA1/START domain
MASANQSQANPGFSLEIRRKFAASREKVFAAWADPRQLEQWMCRDVSSHTIIHHEQDIRTGGRYRMEVRDPAKGKVYWGGGVYREVTPPEKIVFTWSWTITTVDGSRAYPEGPETQVTVEFFARGNSTEVVLTHAVFHSVKDRDDHNRGWNGCLDVLATVLQTTSTPA